MTVTTKDTGFRSQAAAVREARLAIWGDVPFSQRSFVDPKNSPDVAFYDHRGCPVIAVQAMVNGHLVVIEFDHYGRVGNGTRGVTVVS